MLLRCLLLAVLSTAATAADISFSGQIAPILTDKCVECHREAKSKGSYRLDTFQRLLKAGESDAPALTPGQPDKSELYRLLVTDVEADRMPKKADPLSQEEIQLIKDWIAQGAKFDGPDPARLLSDSITHSTPHLEHYPRPLPVTALAASPDSQLLATSGYGEVLLWDLGPSTRLNLDAGPPPPRAPFIPRLAGRIGGLPERVLDIEWSAKGNLLAVAGGTPGRGGELWLVDAAQRQPLKRLLTTPDTLLCLALNREQDLLAVGGTDNHVRVYELPTGRLRWDTEGHADWIVGIAFSPDSKLLATASRDRTARLFDVAHGIITATHTGHEVAVLSIAFDAESRHLASGGFDGLIRRWNLDGENEKNGTYRPLREPVLQLLQHDRQTFAAFGNGRVIETNLIDKKTVRTLVESGPRADVLSYLPTPPTLLIGSRTGEVTLLDPATGKPCGKFLAVP